MTTSLGCAEVHCIQNRIELWVRGIGGSVASIVIPASASLSKCNVRAKCVRWCARVSTELGYVSELSGLCLFSITWNELTPTRIHTCAPALATPASVSVCSLSVSLLSTESANRSFLLWLADNLKAFGHVTHTITFDKVRSYCSGLLATVTNTGALLHAQHK